MTVYVLHALVLIAAAIAVYTDVRWRRIPNVLCASLAALAIAIQTYRGWQFGLVAVGLALAVMALGLVAFSLGWLGGGDVKLAAAISAAFGYPDAVAFILYTSLSGGILALVALALNGQLVSGLRNVVSIVRPLAYQGTAAVAPRTSITLPYACAIALGALAVVLSYWVAPVLRLHL